MPLVSRTLNSKPDLPPGQGLVFYLLVLLFGLLVILIWGDEHPATSLLLVHPRPPASGSLLPNAWFSAVPEGLKEFHLYFSRQLFHTVRLEEGEVNHGLEQRDDLL